MKINLSKRNPVLTLLMGSSFAQALPIAISPILTRIYSIEDFGVFAAFLSISAILQTFINGKYELALVTSTNKFETIHIAALGLIIATVISLILTVIIFLFAGQISDLLDIKGIGNLLFFLPITIFLSGLWNIFNYLAISLQKYNHLKNVSIQKSIFLAISQLSLGFFKTGILGLLLAQTLSQISGNLHLKSKLGILKPKIFFKIFSTSKLKKVMIKYINFPKYQVLSTFANQTSRELINISTVALYGLNALGLLGLTNRVLSAPLTIMTSIYYQVLLKEASDERKITGSASKSFKRTLQRLIYTGLPIFAIIFLTAEDSFALIFGESWREAGTYAKLMTPLLFIRFVSSPLAAVTQVFNKQKSMLYINLSLILVSLIIIVSTVVFSLEFLDFLVIFTYANTICYIYFIFYYSRIIK